MKNLQAQRPPSGFALVLVLVAIGICFLLLAGVLLWSSNSGQASLRHSEHYATLAAAEAATEKIVAQISDDFRTGGRTEVDNNLASYPGLVPSAAEHAVWNNYDFLDEAGTPGRAYVAVATNWHSGPVNWKGGNLVGQSATYRVVATARSSTTPTPTTAAVRQDLEMATVPLASFFMFAQPDLELSPGSGWWTNNGPVHGNANLYFSPSVSVTFADQVTAAGQILHQRAPGDPLGSGGGTITYLGTHESEAGMLRLSLAGLPTNPTNLWTFCRARADLQITIISNNVVTAVDKNGFWVDPTNVLAFLKPEPTGTEGIIADWRECDVDGGERIIATRFDVAQFQAMSAALGNPRSVYLEDHRSPGNFGSFSSRFYAVKLTSSAINGQLAAEFTLATPQPLYVQGPFNAPHPGLALDAKRVGLIADAVTILSGNWNDEKSHEGLDVRIVKTNTTINAAIVTGNVPTQEGTYSGGMENLVRLLENWNPGPQRNLYLYGSLGLLFHSQIATGEWTTSDVYVPPHRVFRFAPQIGATAPIMKDLEAGMLIRSAWRTTSPGSTE